ncbi:MAG: BolA family protein [Limnothrix sp. BL-A-16]|jgi:acid stress-induced BolA-like protein IbaG/YrbA
MVTPDRITTAIKATLPDAEIQLAGDGDHYEAIVVSAAFAGKSRVQQHQLVYGALNDDLRSGALHALALKTFTPESWAAQQATA